MTCAKYLLLKINLNIVSIFEIKIALENIRKEKEKQKLKMKREIAQKFLFSY